MISIGKIYVAQSQYFDKFRNVMSYKKRPVLIIGVADEGDYNILPLSRVDDKSNLDADYDILLDPANFPKLKLNYNSYVRVHKQGLVHSGNIDLTRGDIGDIACDYPATYKSILDKWNDYNAYLMSKALI